MQAVRDEEKDKLEKEKRIALSDLREHNKPLVTDAGGDQKTDDGEENKGANDDGSQEAKPKKQSNWLQKIRKEQLNRDQRQAAEKEERARRLKALLDSDDEDNDE